MNKEISIYVKFESWLNETPEAVLKGTVREKNPSYIVITDDNGYTQILNLDKLFAVVY